MDVLFETQCGKKFCIELGYWDTVSEIKKKIEKYQRFPVLIQTLVFQGNVLQDHLYIGKCKIVHNSRVILFVSPYPYNPNDPVLQSEQSSIPSNPIGDLIYGEDLPLTTEAVLNIRLFFPVMKTDEIYVQDSPVRNNDQSPPSDAAKQIINGHQDSTVTVHQVLQSPPSNSVKMKISIQDSPVKVSIT
ncbi:PREDICTED: uncharacterized protein LOC104707698 [Camelina sativa]|uniref:Uncharacterized protein LOC104707698 n=1 Tax=Camelina sativa TaxID=90675 RepID=A0ABM0T8C0_CAMSA|nr:PREDICTED: uncharacterized protein LOC104707698 [Camelina sativa]